MRGDRLRLLARGLLWLALLGPFFFLSYGFANQITSGRAHVPSFVFAWEHWIPFLPWTIIPYWSSDLLYILSVFVCRTQRELDTHANRLFVVQIICISCFLLFPLRCVFTRPIAGGIAGSLFDTLNTFDKPFNQAPSLHVSLAVVLWSCFAGRLRGFWRFAMGAWLVLVALSTLTTWQHQFIDLPTGALAGCLATALIPGGSVRTRREDRLRLATFYLSGSVSCAAVAFRVGGFGLIFLWPAAALLVTAILYAADWPRFFLNPIIRAITAPYIAVAFANSRWWTRRTASPIEITDGIWLGRVPGWFDRRPRQFGSIVRLCAELPVSRRGAACKSIPILDLITPSPDQLRDAVTAIEGFGSQRPTLVCCALGFSRSAAAIAAWLVWTGRAVSGDEAIRLIRMRQPQIVITGATAAAIDESAQSRGSLALRL